MNSEIDMLKRHLLLSFQMLRGIINICPDDVWYGSDENRSIWKRVLHVLESIDYWLDDFEMYSFTRRLPNYTAEMDQTNASALQRNELADYSNSIALRIEHFFENVTSPMLTEQSKKHPKVTYLDIVLSQVRHIQLNIGYCNEILNTIGYKGTGWTGHGEEC